MVNQQNTGNLINFVSGKVSSFSFSYFLFLLQISMSVFFFRKFCVTLVVREPTLGKGVKK